MVNRRDSARTSAVAARVRAILKAQTIDENGPGTILSDLRTFLGALAPKGFVLSAKGELLRSEALRIINARLARPIELDLSRAVQKSYPNVNGLYWLARESGLATIVGSAAKSRLAADAQALSVWSGLNPTEQYMSLLETWLLSPDSQLRPGGMEPVIWVSEFVLKLPAKGLNLAADRRAADLLSFQPGLHNLALLDLFGLTHTRSAKPKPGGGWHIASVHPTEFGLALLDTIYQQVATTGLAWVLEAGPAGALQPLLQPYFPDWKRNFVAPEPARPESGVRIFKVSLGRVWRRIAMRGSAKLADLASTILTAYGFDFDHLYSFLLKDKKGHEFQIQDPMVGEEPSADEVRIDELPLRPGGSMTYWYDFGDDWMFKVKLETIEPEDAKGVALGILDGSGEAPEQYPEF